MNLNASSLPEKKPQQPLPYPSSPTSDHFYAHLLDWKQQTKATEMIINRCANITTLSLSHMTNWSNNPYLGDPLSTIGFRHAGLSISLLWWLKTWINSSISKGMISTLPASYWYSITSTMAVCHTAFFKPSPRFWINSSLEISKTGLLWKYPHVV